MERETEKLGPGAAVLEPDWCSLYIPSNGRGAETGYTILPAVIGWSTVLLEFVMYKILHQC